MSRNMDEVLNHEKFFEFFADDGLSYEEVLLQQEGMFQSFQEYEKNKRVIAAKKQEAIDEALARSLQELGDGFDDLIVSEHSRSASGSTQSPIATPSRAHAASSNLTQDSIDVDNMQYEELLELGATIGSENRGLSESRIGKLPCSTCWSGLYSKKKQNCVICQTDFNFGEELITLPCSHGYHKECITAWLKVNKVCPLCNKEVI